MRKAVSVLNTQNANSNTSSGACNPVNDFTYQFKLFNQEGDSSLVLRIQNNEEPLRRGNKLSSSDYASCCRTTTNNKMKTVKEN